LDAARDDFIHVDRLAEQVDRGPVAVVHAPRPVGCAGKAVVLEAGAAGDLVLELLVEHADVRADDAARVEGRHLGARARLWSQPRAADERPRALRAEARDAFGKLLETRSLEAPAHAALERPGLMRREDHVRARAGVAAERAVVVVAKSEGHGDLRREPPLVL